MITPEYVAEQKRINKNLRALMDDVAADQQPLGDPFEQILNDNLWDLYET